MNPPLAADTARADPTLQSILSKVDAKAWDGVVLGGVPLEVFASAIPFIAGLVDEIGFTLETGTPGRAPTLSYDAMSGGQTFFSQMRLPLRATAMSRPCVAFVLPQSSIRRAIEIVAKSAWLMVEVRRDGDKMRMSGYSAQGELLSSVVLKTLTTDTRTFDFTDHYGVCHRVKVPLSAFRGVGKTTDTVQMGVNEDSMEVLSIEDAFESRVVNTSANGGLLNLDYNTSMPPMGPISVSPKFLMDLLSKRLGGVVILTFARDAPLKIESVASDGDVYVWHYLAPLSTQDSDSESDSDMDEEDEY